MDILYEIIRCFLYLIQLTDVYIYICTRHQAYLSRVSYSNMCKKSKNECFITIVQLYNTQHTVTQDNLDN